MDHGKAAAVSLAVCGALLLVGCKHPPVELGHDVKVVCIKDQTGGNDFLHLKENRTTFQFGRSWMLNRFDLEEWTHVDFPWEHARNLQRLECEQAYTWSEVQTGNTTKCFPAVAAAAPEEESAEPEPQTMSTSALPDPCESTCGTNPYRRVQGYVELHSGTRAPNKMVRHCVQLYDIVASDGRKAGVLLKLRHPEGGAHAGYAHGEEQ
jgi:hypothetical protein